MHGLMPLPLRRVQRRAAGEDQVHAVEELTLRHSRTPAAIFFLEERTDRAENKSVGSRAPTVPITSRVNKYERAYSTRESEVSVRSSGRSKVSTVRVAILPPGIDPASDRQLCRSALEAPQKERRFNELYLAAAIPLALLGLALITKVTVGAGLRRLGRRGRIARTVRAPVPVIGALSLHISSHPRLLSPSVAPEVSERTLSSP